MSAARVVAANESRSDITGPASNDHGSLDSSSGVPESANTSRTQLPDVCPSGRGLQRHEASYEPHVHVLTGARVQIPISIDRQTGRRELLAACQLNFVLPASVREDEPKHPLTSLRSVLCIKDTTESPSAVRLPLLPPQLAPPTGVRRLDFEPIEQHPHVTTGKSSCSSLLFTAISKIHSKLASPDAADFLTDFKAALPSAPARRG